MVRQVPEHQGNLLGGKPEPAELGLSDPGQEERARQGLPIVPVFDGYRAAAIFGVVLLHLSDLAPLPADWVNPFDRFLTATLGQMIDVLFIVSGFVVFLPTAVRGNFGKLSHYAIRRATRLLPAYYAALVISALIVGMLPSIQSIGLHLIGAQTALVYLPAFGGGGEFPTLGPLWTLSVEIGFYLVLPLVAMAFYRHPVAGLVIAAVIAVVWTQLNINAQAVWAILGVDLSNVRAVQLTAGVGIQLPFWAFSFALGMLGAKIFAAVEHGWREADFRRWAGAAQIMAAAGLIAAGYLMYQDPDAANPYIAAQDVRHSPLVSIGFSLSLAVFMVATIWGPSPITRLFSIGPIRWLAEISYGVYLIHVLAVFVVVRKLGLGPPDDWTSFLILSASVLAGSTIYGYLSARLLEQPIRRWARRFSRTT